MIPNQNTAVRGLLTAGVAAAVVVFVLLLAAEQTSVGWRQTLARPTEMCRTSAVRGWHPPPRHKAALVYTAHLPPRGVSALGTTAQHPTP